MTIGHPHLRPVVDPSPPTSPVEADVPTEPGPRVSLRGAAVAELLTRLDALVRREVTRDGAGLQRWGDDAERITAEVAIALDRVRADLRRHARV